MLEILGGVVIVAWFVGTLVVLVQIRDGVRSILDLLCDDEEDGDDDDPEREEKPEDEEQTEEDAPRLLVVNGKG